MVCPNLRDLPVVVDAKFIENHKGILAELLPITAPQTEGEDNSSFELHDLVFVASSPWCECDSSTNS